MILLTAAFLVCIGILSGKNGFTEYGSAFILCVWCLCSSILYNLTPITIEKRQVVEKDHIATIFPELININEFYGKNYANEDEIEIKFHKEGWYLYIYHERKMVK